MAACNQAARAKAALDPSRIRRIFGERYSVSELRLIVEQIQLEIASRAKKGRLKKIA